MVCSLCSFILQILMTHVKETSVNLKRGGAKGEKDGDLLQTSQTALYTAFYIHVTQEVHCIEGPAIDHRDPHIVAD